LPIYHTHDPKVKAADEIMRHKKEIDLKIQNQLNQQKIKRKGKLSGNASNYKSMKGIDVHNM
jgi:hypothetical protein